MGAARAPRSPMMSGRTEFYQPVPLADLDPFAREMARRWQAGDVSEPDALVRIFEAVIRTPLLDYSIRQHLFGHVTSDDLIADLYSVLQVRLYQLMHPYTSATRAYSLERVAEGTSTRSWVSQTCRTIVARTVRDIRQRDSRRKTFPSAFEETMAGSAESGDRLPGGGSMIGVRGIVGGTSAQSHYGRTIGVVDLDPDDEIGMSRLQAGDLFTDRLNALHGPRRIAGSAALSRGLYGLPRALGPDEYAERTKMSDLLESSPELGPESFVAALRIRNGNSEDSEALDDSLLALWDDYSDEDIERVLEIPRWRDIIAAIAQEAVCPKARPNKKKLTKVIRALKRDADKDHGDFVSDLVQGYVAYYCETTTSYQVLDEDTRAAQEDEASRRRLTYPPLLEEAAKKHDQVRLGTTPDEITDTLRGLLIEDYDQELRDLEAQIREEAAS